MSAVVFTRGGLPESEHRLAWCVADARGTVHEVSVPGAEGLEVFARSSSKPFQALPAVRAGLIERLGLGAEHLAVACASHGGSEQHVALVHEILGAGGVSESDLGCGPLEPRDPAVAAALRAAGGQPGRITHNCSGKHALGLALCVHSGWPTGGYLDAGHPLQDAMHDAIAEAAGEEPEEVPNGTDGCGMRTHHLVLASLAAAFGRLAAGALGAAGDTIAAAMRAHPDAVAYAGAIDTELMRAEEGLVAKIGAEGLLCIGLADGRGAALKVLDGAGRALDPAGVALARDVLGLEAGGDALDALAHPVVLNSREQPVGEGEARLHQRR